MDTERRLIQVETEVRYLRQEVERRLTALEENQEEQREQISQGFADMKTTILQRPPVKDTLVTLPDNLGSRLLLIVIGAVLFGLLLFLAIDVAVERANASGVDASIEHWIAWLGW